MKTLFQAARLSGRALFLSPVFSLLVLLTCALASPSCGEAPKTPEAAGPAAARAEELVKIVNSADVKATKEYIRQSYAPEFLDVAPMDMHIGFLMSLGEEGHGVEFHGLQESSTHRVVALVRGKLTGDWAAVVVEVEPGAPHRIAGLGRVPPKIPASSTSARKLTEEDIVREVDTYVRKLGEADMFSGAVLVAKDGRTLYAKAIGEANKDFGAPNRVDTKFNLGSMNKMFTAVAIAQLVERGKLSFDDPLSKFLPEFPDTESAKKIRIKHLLTHTSGLGSFFNEKFRESSRARFRTVEDWMELVKDETLQFEPGTQWSYSNTGMLVLGAVIEKVTGQSYDDYVRENISKPAGMASTACYELDAVNPNLAVGYHKERSEAGVRFRNNIFAHVIKGGPAGGGYSTVEDLLRFSEALRSNKLVSAETFKTLTTPKPEVSSPEYGYGFGVNPETHIVGHSGGFLGISANLDMFLDSGYTAVVLANYSGASQPVVHKIRELVKAAQ